MIRTGHSKFGFLRMTFAACVGIPLIIASNAFAQNLQPMSTDIGAAPTPPAAAVERIIVTGSNIPTAEEVGPNPVDIYNRENINKSGEFTTERFLQSLPIANANIIPTSNAENESSDKTSRFGPANESDNAGEQKKCAEGTQMQRKKSSHPEQKVQPG